MINKSDYRINTVKCIFKIAGIRGIIDYLLSKISNNLIQIKTYTTYIPGIIEPCYIRIPSSDALTYWQVFVDREYEVVVNKQPAVIMDAGANIGLASIYFAARFPTAQIFAIEPEESNFEMLTRNVAPYKNVTAIHAALWNENKEINLVDPGLGNSGFMTSDGHDKKCVTSKHLVKAMTIDRIIDEYNIENIDILKIDVEGAEMEIFENPLLWIDRVDSLIVELHERMRPGCSINLNRAISGFAHKWVKGENVCAAKDSGCLSITESVNNSV
jgi:FkbM family methyltransferase